MHPETNRKRFFLGIVLGGILATAGFSLLGSGLPAHSEGQAVNKKEEAAQPKHDQHPAANVDVGSAKDRGKLMPGFRKAGLAPVPVEVPDGPPKLPWKMVDGVKEFHLTAEHLKREFLPDVWIDVWGYNGSMPGPMIEVVEGDKVRIIVHNKLPEPTIMHWHGIDVPNAMDGVEGLIQDPIKPGESFTYEFTLKQNGTFFYHTHVAMQQGMGMVGLFIIHPKVAHDPPVDRDIALIIQEWAILPGSTVHNTMSMEFNLFTLNGRAAPYITPMVIKQGERVRIRLVNFSAIDHHPMHLHGMTVLDHRDRGGPHPGHRLDPQQQRPGGGCAGPRHRVRRQQPRRLGVPLPHVPPHDELHVLDGGSDGRRFDERHADGRQHGHRHGHDYARPGVISRIRRLPGTRHGGANGFRHGLWEMARKWIPR